MIAYHFRVLSDGLPNGWVGFAFANNLQELFWQIDNHADPYRVEIKRHTAVAAASYKLTTATTTTTKLIPKLRVMCLTIMMMTGRFHNGY